MAWPDLALSDMETRLRTYVNEAVPSFFTETEVDQWLTIAVNMIAQETECVRRILDAHTTNGSRTVNFNAYKVHHVEYIPATGRSIMLPKISPLQIGRNPTTGAQPQYWFEFGTTIGIDPIPALEYDLRLYVSDIPKIFVESGYTQANWTAGTGWTAGAGSAVHTGASGDLTLTAGLTTAVNYTIIFTTSAISNSGTITPNFGTTAGETVTSEGIHMQTNVMAGTAFKFTGATDITIDDIYILKEADFSSDTDQTELNSAWHHLAVLLGTAQALYKDKRINAGALLESICMNELAFLKQELVDIIPDGRGDLKL